MSTLIVEFAIVAALLSLAAVFLLLEYRTIRLSRGGWRAAATLPAMVVGWIVLGILVNPPAHALWRIEIILWLIPAILALLFLRLVHRRVEGVAAA